MARKRLPTVSLAAGFWLIAAMAWGLALASPIVVTVGPWWPAAVILGLEAAMFTAVAAFLTWRGDSR